MSAFFSSKQLNKSQLKAVRTLAALCKAHDGGHPTLYYHLLSKERMTENNILHFEKGNLIGFLSVYFFYDDACELSLLVAPEHRRKGIAKRLLRAIMPLLKIRRMKTLIFSMATAINENWLPPLGFSYKNSEYHMERHSYQPILVTNQALEIRQSQSDDIPKLCAIDKACFAEQQPNMPAHLVNLLNDENYTIMTALHDNRIVGKAHIRWQKNGSLLSDIGILPEYQRQGWGSELLAYCINYSISLGKTEISLDVESFNRGALNLYIRNGFNTTIVTDYWAAPTEKLNLLI